MAQQPGTADRVALIVRDERGRARLFQLDLRRGAYSVRNAVDLQSALTMARADQPDLVLIDDSSPDAPGRNSLPLSVVWAAGTSPQALTQPSNPEKPAKPDARSARKVFKARDLKVDFEHTRVTRFGRSVVLSPTEFELLKYFIDNRGRVIPRAELLEQVCGYGSQTRSRTIDTHVYNLRRKLKDTAPYRLIQTVHQMGFSFEI